MEEEVSAIFIGLYDYTLSIGHFGQLCLQCDMPIIGFSYIYSQGRISLAGSAWIGLNQALYQELMGQCTLLQQGGQILRLQLADLSRIGFRSKSLAQTVFLGIELIRSSLLITGVFWQHSFPISSKYLRFFFIRKFRNYVSGFAGSGARQACSSCVAFAGVRACCGSISEWERGSCQSGSCWQCECLGLEHLLRTFLQSMLRTSWLLEQFSISIIKNQRGEITWSFGAVLRLSRSRSCSCSSLLIGSLRNPSNHSNEPSGIFPPAFTNYYPSSFSTLWQKPGACSKAFAFRNRRLLSSRMHTIPGF